MICVNDVFGYNYIIWSTIYHEYDYKYQQGWLSQTIK